MPGRYNPRDRRRAAPSGRVAISHPTRNLDEPDQNLSLGRACAGRRDRRLRRRLADAAPAPTVPPAERADYPKAPTKPGVQPPTKPAEAKPADTKSAAAKPAKSLDVAGTKLTDDEIKEISKIEPEADRKIALEQKLCPMSGDHLGSMEEPIKVTLKGQSVFLCCGGCKKGAEADPAGTLAKLGK